MFKLKKILLTAVLSTQVFATYLYDDPNLGNIAIEGGIWNASLNGKIKNTLSTTDLKDDLGYKDAKNITTMGLDIKNNYDWIPNIYINYLHFKETADGNLENEKVIGLEAKNIESSKRFLNSVSTSTDYSELNAIFYGYLQQGIFEFDLGLNFKSISYEQTIKENNTSIQQDEITIKGPDKLFVLPYIGLSINLDSIDTVLKAETSILSFADDDAHDYRYSLNYRIMRHMYISYGYRLHSWKAKSSKNEHEEYSVELKGHYINAKILF
jgi:outer membrane protein